MNVLQQILPYLGFVGIIAGLLGYYGKARGDSIIEYQGKTIDSQKDYISTLEREKATAEAERDLYKQQADTYRESAQGSPQLIKLTAQVKNLAESVAKMLQAREVNHARKR